MGFFFKILGAFAKTNESLSRQRINFIPIHFALLVAAIIMTFVGLAQFQEGMAQSQEPREISLQDLLDHKNLSQKYVKVKGLLIPDSKLEIVSYKEGESIETGKVTEVFLAMLDTKSRRAIYVQMEGLTVDFKKPEVREVTGMISPIEGLVKDEVKKENTPRSKVKIDAKYMLTQGDSPANPRIWAVVMGLSGLYALLTLLVIMKKYTIFRKEADSVEHISAPSLESSNPAVFATGHFYLQDTKKYFVNVPSKLGNTESGEAVIFASIDASSTTFGFTTKKRDGIWTISSQPAQISALEKGIQYWGFKARPALRMVYQDPRNHKASKAILGFNNETERETILQEFKRQGAGSRGGV